MLVLWGSHHSQKPVRLQKVHLETSDHRKTFRVAGVGPSESVQPFISPNFWWKVQFNRVFSISNTVKAFSRNLSSVAPHERGAAITSATALATALAANVPALQPHKLGLVHLAHCRFNENYIFLPPRLFMWGHRTFSGKRHPSVIDYIRVIYFAVEFLIITNESSR